MALGIMHLHMVYFLRHMTVGNHVTTALRLARDDPEVLKGFYSPDKWNHQLPFDKEDRFRSKLGPQYQLQLHSQFY